HRSQQGQGDRQADRDEGHADPQHGVLRFQLVLDRRHLEELGRIHAAIQDELKLTDKQKEQLKSVSETLNQSQRDFFQQTRNSGARFDPESMREAMAAQRQQGELATARVLTTGQRTRLKQIVLQAKGPMAVAEPEIAAELVMTPYQQQQIQTIIEQM